MYALKLARVDEAWPGASSFDLGLRGNRRIENRRTSDAATTERCLAVHDVDLVRTSASWGRPV